MNKLGCKVEFENKISKIYDANRKLIGRGDQTRSNLFYLDIDDATCLIAKLDDTWLWNKKLCHVNLANLISINHKKRVRGFPKLKKLDDVICKQCQLGKMTKSSFKSKAHTSKEILEIVHTNLCGPIEV